MRIFLIGFMGSGKTTFGRRLANQLDYEFYDLDELIEKKAGMSIREYFQESGEDSFRKLEEETLINTPFGENSVIATGGGAPCHFDNIEWMNNNGTTVYISIPPKALADRLEHGQSKRPLIKDFNKEELIDYITNKLVEREDCYNQAHFTVDGTNLTVPKFLEQVEIA